MTGKVSHAPEKISGLVREEEMLIVSIVPSYSGSSAWLTLFAMFGCLPHTTIGMGDMVDVDSCAFEKWFDTRDEVVQCFVGDEMKSSLRAV
jgi:hypothetical protein